MSNTVNGRDPPIVPPPTAALAKAHRLPRLDLICLALVACPAAYFAVHSLLFAASVTGSLPLGDAYTFYIFHYFRFVDGTYSFWHLFDTHNDHLILTTRLVLFADAVWFHASGKFALVVTYLLALAIALTLAHLAATPRKWQVAALAVIFLGLGCARIQLQDLTTPFQVGFFFVHAFALATLIALWRGLAGQRWWYALAFACDFVTVFSLGSGVLIGAAAVALAMWLRKFDRLFALFLVFHAGLVGLVAWMLAGAGRLEVSLPPGWTDLVTFFLVFLGDFVQAWPGWVMPVGTLVAATGCGLLVWVTWRSLRSRAEPGGQADVLAAMVLFLLLEAAIATIARARFSWVEALELRYTNSTLLLVVTLCALAWRLFPQAVSRVAALVALTAVLFASNNVVFENDWRQQHEKMDAIAAAIAKGAIPSGAAATLFTSPAMLEAVIWRYQALGLGPFAHPGGEAR